MIFCFVCWIYLDFVRRGIDTYAEHVCRRRRDRGRRLRRPAKKHEETFPLSYFCMTKSTKSHIRERSPLLYISSRVHELVARAMRGKCVRHKIKQKSEVLRSPQSHTTTRANISHERAEQIRARIVSARPLKKEGRGRESSACADESRDFRQPSPVGN